MLRSCTMATNRLRRSLSAFNHFTHRWVPVPSSDVQNQAMRRLSPTRPNFSSLNDDGNSVSRISLLSWNIDGLSPRPVKRAKLILDYILDRTHSPDVVFFQEVAPAVRESLLDDTRVRGAFLTTDAEDQTSFEDVPFATMTLLSSGRFTSEVELRRKKSPSSEEQGSEQERLIHGQVSRIGFPSKYGRNALSVDIIRPDTPNKPLRLINVHLDSLADTLRHRTQQIEILANVLREPACGSGIIAGDFNAISPEDETLVDKNGLVDAWVALHGKANVNGDTWGVDMEVRKGLAPGRLDKVAMLGVKAEKMEIIRPGSLEVARPAKEPLMIPWSDHCGLKCTFTI